MRPHDKKAFIEFMKRRFSQNSHINCSVCSACGGACCKRGGCGLMTCDVPDMSVRGIERLLHTGKFSIAFACAFSDGIPIPIPIMTAREIGCGKINESIIRKPCALQGEKGCLLSEEERPTQGLLFIPKANGDCKNLVGAMEVFADWAPYKEILETVIEKETGKTLNELFYKGCIEAAMQIRQKLDTRTELTDSEADVVELLEATGTILIAFE